METLTEFTVQNGAVTEVYAVELDCGEIFIRASMDAHVGGPPADFVHIDRSAVRPLIIGLELALLRTVPVLIETHPNVVDFPRMMRS